MSAAPSAVAPPLDWYQLRLPAFEGPLDVLLRLIERRELEITTISLVSVTDQFLTHLAALPDRDPALLAEFAAIASRLLLLKTRVLFPRQPAAAPVEEDEDDGEELVRRLAEYRRVKEAAQHLAAREAAGWRAFEPLGAPDAAETIAVEVALAPARPADLVRAVQRRLARLPVVPRVLALAPRISVGEMAARIAERLRGHPRGEVRWSGLVTPTMARVEVVTVFMAILELVRRRRAEAWQDEPFGEIVVTRTPAEAALPGSTDD